ncbi:conserved oligomeric Golgi complex subunit 3 [Episyrphus balteatus]|uniref:conserved oligomeric Golgi complex subunit 3 n=1 Tax=Episyrphus balteatus TaxID=286459 RepID=UPI002485FE1A|nr:conserved oligomeric Golgi complex subunit 3 [Episyrphus balteatus]
MVDVASAQSENDNLRKIRFRLLQWESKEDPIAGLTPKQEECMEKLASKWKKIRGEISDKTPLESLKEEKEQQQQCTYPLSKIFKDLESSGIKSTHDFLLWHDRVKGEIHENANSSYERYLQQLELRSEECRVMLQQVDTAMGMLNNLNSQYDFVSHKTSSLNTASQQLIDEQKKMQEINEEIQRRLQFFNQVELLYQRIQSPTLSVASESFRECLSKIDDCIKYLQQNPNYKDSSAFIVKYKHILSKAIALIKNYVITVISQATHQTLAPKNVGTQDTKPNAEAAFALYYGKYQASAIKIKRVSQLVEDRLSFGAEYEQLLSDIHNNYLSERANIMSPAVESAIQDLKITYKGDQCSLMRSACGFLVHVCQDEHRLFFQYFSVPSDQLISYLEGLCTILYDTMRPMIIHVNHLETLAEICSILRIEMIEEQVQQNREQLEAFDRTANQMLQDVQERLVFRAHLYLQSDILHYNPSAGDLAYPEKLEMMESIALSLQEPTLRRSDSRSSLISTVSNTESVDTNYRTRNLNSPADLHGMWYPTVRRTLVCLSRLYRCVDRPIFQGLSQEALRLCIQSVSKAASKISSSKTSIDGELFEIKHLLILREQIAPFRVDFTVKETSLDFSKVKTAAFGLLQKRKQLFSMGSNNAILEFLLEGTPQIKEHLLDSRKEVDQQLKSACERFIKDAVQMLIGPLLIFLEKAQTLVSQAPTMSNKEQTTPSKFNYTLRQSSWASPQHISSIIQETQRLIKVKLCNLQRSMQLYLSNRDTEFIIFRPIRNNIISSFVKLEQILATNGYSQDDMIITSCPSAEQVSILLSSASILAAEAIVNFSGGRKISTSSNEGHSQRKISLEKKKIKQ